MRQTAEAKILFGPLNQGVRLVGESLEQSCIPVDLNYLPK